MKEKITRFEDLISWQKARELTKEIYRQTGQGSLSRDYGLRDQIQRASVSIMSNLAEGAARTSSQEFAQFLNIAGGSLSELDTQIEIAGNLQYLTGDEKQIIDQKNRINSPKTCRINQQHQKESRRNITFTLHCSYSPFTILFSHSPLTIHYSLYSHVQHRHSS